MHPKTRIAVLIAALIVGTQVGIATIAEFASAESTAVTEQRADTIAHEAAVTVEPAATSAPAAKPERFANAEAAAAPVSRESPGVVQSAASKLRGWYDRFVIALRSATPPPVFPQGANGDVGTWLMPVQIAYFERLEQQQLARVQPQAAPQAEAQPAAADIRAQYGSTNLIAAHEVAAGAAR